MLHFRQNKKILWHLHLSPSSILNLKKLTKYLVKTCFTFSGLKKSSYEYNYLKSASSGSKNQTTARVKLMITYEDLEKTYLFHEYFQHFICCSFYHNRGTTYFQLNTFFFLFFMISFSRQVCTAFFTNRYVFSWILWTKLVKDFLALPMALPDLTTNFQVNNF